MSPLTRAPAAVIAALALTSGCTFDYDALGAEAGGGAPSTGSPTSSSTAAETSAASTGQGGATSATTSTSSTASTGEATGTGGSTTGAGGSGAGGAPGDGGGGAGGAPPPALPRHCLDVLEAQPNAEDGDYLVDPDGPGDAQPIQVRCDMTTEGGGWTRFNWLYGNFPTGGDPLAQPLEACAIDAELCPGRIPPGLTPTELLVKDVSDGEYALWALDGSEIGQAMLLALRDKTEACIVDGARHDPSVETSDEEFCDDSSGGCDSFKYTDSGCQSTTGWVLTLDDDSHYCRAAFKLGRATGSGNCGEVDWGFLDDCACEDESGELLFR